MRAPCLGLFVAMLVACGPGPRDPAGGGDDSQVDAPSAECVPVPEVCGDGIDNDCDLRVDCGDPDCSGIGGCPVCGSVEYPESQPLALPDGIGQAQTTTCSTDAQCTNPMLPYCVFKECHASYASTLDFVGFPQGATLEDPSKLLSVCATLEHSWLRDLQIDLVTPDHRIITLHEFIGRMPVQETYLGQPNDNDTASNPIPGIGAKYCWTPGAAKTMLETAPSSGHFKLPAGDYRSVSPWAAMVGVPLNGPWTIRVTDLWPIDNGFLFDWSIAFDPSLVVDCSGPIIQ